MSGYFHPSPTYQAHALSDATEKLLDEIESVMQDTPNEGQFASQPVGRGRWNEDQYGYDQQDEHEAMPINFGSGAQRQGKYDIRDQCERLCPLDVFDDIGPGSSRGATGKGEYRAAAHVSYLPQVQRFPVDAFSDFPDPFSSQQRQYQSTRALQQPYRLPQVRPPATQIVTNHAPLPYSPRLQARQQDVKEFNLWEGEDAITENQRGDDRHDEMEGTYQYRKFHGFSRQQPNSRRGQPAQQMVIGKKSMGIDLIPTNMLPDIYRRVFPFDHFNAVQSKCFEAAFESDDNFVLSSPTASGKTVIFELAVLRLAKKNQNMAGQGNEAAIRGLSVYISPTKALCTERQRDWSEKFQPIGLNCMEFTGDTAITKDFLSEAKKIDIIITTPEKWDSVTRRASQNQKLLSRLGLVMIDEVHILHESRGSVLEALVARLRTRDKDAPIRLVALSATIPNVDDIAIWLRPKTSSSSAIYEAGGSPGRYKSSEADSALKLPMARVLRFGADFRPTKLDRFVYSYPVKSPWGMTPRIQNELFQLLVKHCANKPVLVFCPTRKDCGKLADAIMKSYKEAKSHRSRVPWQVGTSQGLHFKDKKLSDWAEAGLAVHHAGLDYQDRRTIEDAFKNDQLKAIFCTSTLAVGVNLPAHTVVIAGTFFWDGTRQAEYPDLDIQQMLGRAGRPQFDDSGTAVILCTKEQNQKYKDLLGSKTVIESCLHENLTEHINSEIGLGTIKDIDTGQEWIRSTFLYVRIQRNPKYYAAALRHTGNIAIHWQKALDDLMRNAVNKLEEAGLVSMNPTDPENDEDPNTAQILATTYGKIMSDDCISFGTMQLIMNIEPNSTFRALLEVLSNAAEFQDVKLRMGEKAIYNKLNQSEELRYPLGRKPSTSADKVFLLIQICLGNISLDHYKESTENSNPTFELLRIWKIAPRICKAIVKVAIEKEDGGSLKAALELVRSINGKAWENTSTVFRQIDDIGAKSIKVLGANGIITFRALAQTDPRRVEMLLNRAIGFGNRVVDRAKTYPQFRLELEQITQISESNTPPAEISYSVRILCEGDIQDPSTKKSTYSERTISLLAVMSDGALVKYCRIPAKHFALEDNRKVVVTATFTRPNQKLQVIVGVDQLSGCSAFTEIRPERPAVAFGPAIDTRPGEEDEDQADIEVGGQVDLELEEDTLVESATLRQPSIDALTFAGPEEFQPPAAQETTQGSTDALIRLPNGNYKCGHTCSGSCQHSCCVEGSKKPPKRKKSSKSQQWTLVQQKEGVALHTADPNSTWSEKRQAANIVSGFPDDEEEDTRPKPKPRKRKTPVASESGISDEEDENRAKPKRRTRVMLTDSAATDIEKQASESVALQSERDPAQSAGVESEVQPQKQKCPLRPRRQRRKYIVKDLHFTDLQDPDVSHGSDNEHGPESLTRPLRRLIVAGSKLEAGIESNESLAGLRASNPADAVNPGQTSRTMELKGLSAPEHIYDQVPSPQELIRLSWSPPILSQDSLVYVSNVVPANSNKHPVRRTQDEEPPLFSGPPSWAYEGQPSPPETPMADDVGGQNVGEEIDFKQGDQGGIGDYPEDDMFDDGTEPMCGEDVGVEKSASPSSQQNSGSAPTRREAQNVVEGVSSQARGVEIDIEADPEIDHDSWVPMNEVHATPDTLQNSPLFDSDSQANEEVGIQEALHRPKPFISQLAKQFQPQMVINNPDSRDLHRVVPTPTAAPQSHHQYHTRQGRLLSHHSTAPGHHHVASVDFPVSHLHPTKEIKREAAVGPSLSYVRMLGYGQPASPPAPVFSKDHRIPEGTHASMVTGGSSPLGGATTPDGIETPPATEREILYASCLLKTDETLQATRGTGPSATHINPKVDTGAVHDAPNGKTITRHNRAHPTASGGNDDEDPDRVPTWDAYEDVLAREVKEDEAASESGDDIEMKEQLHEGEWEDELATDLEEEQNGSILSPYNDAPASRKNSPVTQMPKPSQPNQYRKKGVDLTLELGDGMHIDLSKGDGMEDFEAWLDD